MTNYKTIVSALLVLCLTVCMNVNASSNVLVFQADRIFDGYKVQKNKAVVVKDKLILDIVDDDKLSSFEHVIKLGNVTLLPAFFDLHSHVNYRSVPKDVLLRNGLSLVRDLGGPKNARDHALTVLTSGLILTSPHGYPINKMGAKDIAIAIHSEQEARAVVKQQIKEGATTIKIALETGGEYGAPWTASHHHHASSAHNDVITKHHTKNVSQHQHQHEVQKWPLLSSKIVQAIVNESHNNGVKVTAHIGEGEGLMLALNAGVDEFSHLPCDPIAKGLLEQAVNQKVVFITTIDTLSKCNGIAENTQVLASLGAQFLYGAEIAHSDIPWGIDAQELMLIHQMTGKTIEQVLQLATSKPAEYLGFEHRGIIASGARADFIVVDGDVRDNLKSLEYPRLVVNQGEVVVNYVKPSLFEQE